MGLDLTGLGSVADLAKGLVDRFLPPAATEVEKLAAQAQVQQMIDVRESAVLEAQRSIMVAELAQGDNYTKRARPSIVYFGLIFIGMVHVLIPMMAWTYLMVADKPLTSMPTFVLPDDFWWVWGSVCAVWSIGRDAARGGVTSKLVGMVTGSK